VAGIKIEGLDQILKQLRDIGATATIEALEAAENAAANVIKKRLQQAAPVGSAATKDKHPGQLKKSIRIVKYKDRAQLHGLTSMVIERGATQKLVIGPERKTGFYGFFLEHGWQTPSFRRLKGYKYVKKQYPDQRPISGGHKGWFTAVQETVEASAIKAGEEAALRLLRKFL